jgi:serine phosphatase RsbU (regulator of sigma subunit)/Na+/proline symporter
MISVSTVTIVSLLYFGLLFAVAYYADQRRKAGKSITANASVYALSMAVYLTSWTFYGSVGRAATSGLDFLPIYLGPTLMAFTWWFLLRKMVHISKEHRIVSIADFISSRYGKSAVMGAAVTIFAVLGIMPYIALQLKAVAHTFDLLSLSPKLLGSSVARVIPPLSPDINTALILAIVLGLFGILFGARTLDAAERHEGLVAAVALESIVKLVAFLAAGIYVTYGLFDGFSDIFTRFRGEFPNLRHLLLLNTSHISYPLWFSLTFVSMMAFMFLPRQFHIMVIESSDEKHIIDAMWRFPTYMFLINIFVLPIALAGLLLKGGNTLGADYFVLSLPLQTGHQWLALLVFIGGFSASAGMVMVESVALSTMVLNHLVMPLIIKFRVADSEADISTLLINIKRLGIIIIVLLGYLYYRTIGGEEELVVIGLMLGFIVWFYTLLVPSFVLSGWIPASLLSDGPFGIHLLRPLHLFGLMGFDIWSHALFWTMFFNIGAFLAFSFLTGQSTVEKEQALKFVDTFGPEPEATSRKRISKAPTIMEFVDLMNKFIGEKQAHQAIADYLGNREIDETGRLSDDELPHLKRFTERTLAGSVGAAPARIIIENYLATRGSKMEDVFDIFGTVTISRKTSREQLSVLYEAARVVASGADQQTILDNILELLMEQFKFDLCVIRIVDETKNALVVLSQKGMSSAHLGEAERNLTHDTCIGEAFLDNTTKVENDCDLLKKPATAKIVRHEGIKSFVHTPIAIEGEPIGVISAFSRSAKGIFTNEFVEMFQSVARQIGVAIRNARQTEDLIRARQQEREMQIAKTIQLSLLPTAPPDIKGVKLAGICVPARSVGGDYYDFIARGEEALDLVIADVSGHNVGAALIMAETRTFIKARAHTLGNASSVMRELNEFFYQDLTQAELFITMFYLKYNTATRELSYASAGHNQPLVFRTGQTSCERLDAEGLIFGIRTNVDFEEKKTILNPGDILLLYTDGIVEAEAPNGLFFGMERLCALIQDYRDRPSSEIIDNVLRQVRLFTGQEHFTDDVSLVVMQVGE